MIRAVAILTLVGFTSHSCNKQNLDTSTMGDSLNIKTVTAEKALITPEDSLSNIEKALIPGEAPTAASKYSSLMNENIDLQKTAIALNPLQEGKQKKAYLLFNGDQSKAEIFLPDETSGTIYKRTGTEGNYTWTDGQHEVIQWKGYVIRTVKDKTPLFAGDKI